MKILGLTVKLKWRCLVIQQPNEWAWSLGLEWHGHAWERTREPNWPSRIGREMTITQTRFFGVATSILVQDTGHRMPVERRLTWKRWVKR